MTADGVRQPGGDPDRAGEIDAETLLFGVMGDPVSHSLGPAMHNPALRRIGINGVYLAFRVSDPGSAVAAMRALSIKGMSVTIPHKVAVIDHLDAIDPMAARIGAVNTLVLENGRLLGLNTDGPGAVRALKAQVDPAGKRVAVVGAGGAARAVVFGLKDGGAVPTILNRTLEKGRRLADAAGVECRPLASVDGPEWEILINTTPLGMVPKTDGMPVPERCLEPGMVVMDIVYNPLRTRLLKTAEERGCRIVDGLAMFVYQGAAQLERWTGRPAPADVMRAAVRRKLTEGR